MESCLYYTSEQEQATFMTTEQDRHWNIFAWELQRILATHNYLLSTLQQAGISQDKVQRLQESLYTSPGVPVLNPAELTLLRQTLSFSDEELTCLHAALLAAAIQQVLIEHIDKDQTFHMASLMYESARTSLWEQQERKKICGTDRGGDSETGENTYLDTTWIFVKHGLDTGDLVLQLSHYASSHKTKIKKAREAYTAFESALFELNSLDSAIKAMSIWRKRYNEARFGMEAARQRLKELEVQ
jgi:hypothetical protein